MSTTQLYIRDQYKTSMIDLNNSPSHLSDRTCTIVRKSCIDIVAGVSRDMDIVEQLNLGNTPYHSSASRQEYVRYDYTTSESTLPLTSPPRSASYTYYVPPQYKSPTASPKQAKRHSRNIKVEFPLKSIGT